MGRKTEISVLNVLFCLMVIFIHVTSYPITQLPADSFVVKMLYPVQKLCGVAVYGFIFLSGLKLFLGGRNISLKKYYFSRIKRVYFPYIIFTVVYYLYEVNRGYFTFNLKELSVFLLNGNVECHLYFVVIIMQFYLLFPLWRYLINSKHSAVILLSSAILNILFVYKLPVILETAGIKGFSYNDRVFTSYLFFWLLGCFCGKNYEKFKNALSNGLSIYLLLFLTAFVVDTFLSFKAFTGQRFYAVGEAVHLLYCFGAILFLYSAVLIFKDCGAANNKFMKAVDTASFEIYLVHILFVHIVNDIIANHFSAGALEAYVIRFISVYLLSIVSCILYKKLISVIKR